MRNHDKKQLLADFDLGVRWLALGDLTGEAELSCIDGRHHGHVLGAPGGDIGELVLLLGTIEALSSATFGADRIERIMRRYLDRHGRFYKHTDRNALMALETTIAEDTSADGEELRRALATAGSIDALVTEPPTELRDKLAELLVIPRHVGCGHLRSMLEYAGEYGVRRNLVEDAIASFFRLLWSGAPQTDFTILEGQHEESLILTFDTDQELTADTLMPSVCSSEDGPFLFANHEAARRYKRRLDVDLLDDLVDLSALADSPEQAKRRLLDEAQRLARVQAAATIAHLAPDLPAYTITYRGRELDVDTAGPSS
jgi:hypothetical protein